MPECQRSDGPESGNKLLGQQHQQLRTGRIRFQFQFTFQSVAFRLHKQQRRNCLPGPAAGTDRRTGLRKERIL